MDTNQFIQDQLIVSIGDQLTAVQATVGWGVGVGLAAAWTGFQREETISILSLSVARKHALIFIVAAFLFVNFASVVYCLRLADLVRQLDPDQLEKAVKVIETHPWAFNPY